MQDAEYAVFMIALGSFCTFEEFLSLTRSQRIAVAEAIKRMRK